MTTFLNIPSGKFAPMIRHLREEETFFFEQERRLTQREMLVRPVTLFLPHEERKIECFSRNISSGGLSIVSPDSFELDFESQVIIHRLHGTTYSIGCRCIWSTEFGDAWFLTGWEFVEPM